MKDKAEDKEKTISIVRELSELTDLAAFMDYVGRKTKYGRKPHPSDPWAYTREFLVKYKAEDQFDEVVRLFTDAGATSETQAALLVAANMKHVPKGG